MHDEVSTQNNLRAKEDQSHKEKTEDMPKCPEAGNVQSTTLIKCVYCSKNVNNLVRHVILVHKDVKQFSFDLCDFRATRKNSIRTHMEEEHECAVFVCPFCAQRCQLRDDLNKHVRESHI